MHRNKLHAYTEMKINNCKVFSEAIKLMILGRP